MSLNYRPLGRNGLRVSPLCLGTMMFGGETDEATSRRIIDRAFEQGINFIDTADGYAKFQSEVVVGNAIRERRDRWVLATKFASPRGDDPNSQGASRKYIRHAVEGSLRRLGTDYIDIYYLHREDHLTRPEETVRALGELVAEGKIRYWGVSNHRAWRIAEFSRVADSLGLDRPIASQPLYNLANRQVEFEHLDAADHYGLGVVPYSPLARGVLTAKYEPGAAPSADSRAGRNDKRIHQTEWREESLQLAQRISVHAAERGISPGQFALAWVLNNRLVTAPIVGPRTEAQWEDYLPALAYRFTAEDEALVNSLVPSGHASTPGFNDPGHAFFGRRPYVG
ncbi:MAG: L-glyceraldehyde 3-phosphate reductase [Paracidovorax wautersii]|uniref:L-glyceraldehyde 3-phosphate reductase n=1 Tax=Paracidovorax wautersii TaxID=1177982 RepID=A0A7V8FNF2_9BURK|nr:MAG: L-glyceraldehyde 3-phosphate reductase [Paracidovorax wautersii]